MDALTGKNRKFVIPRSEAAWGSQAPYFVFAGDPQKSGMIPRDCHGPLRGLAMTSLTAGSMREGFLQSFPPEGKLGRNQQEQMARVFCRVEVWKAQAYFVYSKPSKPMDRRKSSGSCRRGFLQSFPNREARKKSARAEGERFFVEARFGERRNTLCISSSPNRWIGGKAPASAAEDFFRVFPKKRKGRCDC